MISTALSLASRSADPRSNWMMASCRPRFTGTTTDGDAGGATAGGAAAAGGGAAAAICAAGAGDGGTGGAQFAGGTKALLGSTRWTCAGGGGTAVAVATGARTEAGRIQLLVGEAHHRDLSELLQRTRIPYVNTFVYNSATHGTCVGPDNRKALYELTSYLIKLGHRQFGVVAQSTQNNDRAEARLHGIRDALAEKSIAIQPRHFVQGFWTIKEGRQLFRRLVGQKPWPTAVICGNAYLTVGALLESQAAGISVPTDMSIVGYDDIEIMSELPIPLTTVRVLSDEVGRRAARLLMAKLEGQDFKENLECDAEIIVRQSSGPPPRS